MAKKALDQNATKAEQIASIVFCFGLTNAQLKRYRESALKIAEAGKDRPDNTTRVGLVVTASVSELDIDTIPLHKVRDAFMTVYPLFTATEVERCMSMLFDLVTGSETSPIWKHIKRQQD